MCNVLRRSIYWTCIEHVLNMCLGMLWSALANMRGHQLSIHWTCIYQKTYGTLIKIKVKLYQILATITPTYKQHHPLRNMLNIFPNLALNICWGALTSMYWASIETQLTQTTAKTTIRQMVMNWRQSIKTVSRIQKLIDNILNIYWELVRIYWTCIGDVLTQILGFLWNGKP